MICSKMKEGIGARLSSPYQQWEIHQDADQKHLTIDERQNIKREWTELTDDHQWRLNKTNITRCKVKSVAQSPTSPPHVVNLQVEICSIKFSCRSIASMSYLIAQCQEIVIDLQPSKRAQKFELANSECPNHSQESPALQLCRQSY